MSESTPIRMLRAAMDAFGTMLCVGLDPDPRRFPEELKLSGHSIQDQTCQFLRAVVDQTAPHACAFKPQKAFFDAIPQGREILADIVRYVRTAAPNRPIFVDCKIGDTGNTMEVYLGNLFGAIDADGVVVNPYMGSEVFEPFDKLPDKVALVLVRTSNPGATAIQDLRMCDGRPLWQHVLQMVGDSNRAGNLIPVVSCDLFCSPTALEGLWPNNGAVLVAGHGAQGGRLCPTSAAVNHTIFVNSSRAILYPSAAGAAQEWRSAIATAAEDAKVALNNWRHQSQEVASNYVSRIGGVSA